MHEKIEALLTETDSKIAETADAVRAAHKVIQDDAERTIQIMKDLGEVLEAAQDTGKLPDGTELSDEELSEFSDAVGELFSENAYDLGMEWDGDHTDPSFWEPSTC